MRIYLAFWLNLPVGFNLIRKINELQYQENFSEGKMKNFSKTVASLFHITQKVRTAQALLFFNLNNAAEKLKTLSVVLIGINFCLLISLYLGRIVCLNLTLVKIKIYNFPLLSILYHRWAEIEHMTRIKNYNIAIINFGQKMTTS